MSVTVFTTGPSCHLCRVTKVHMQRRGIDFVEVRLDENPVLAEKIRELGFVAAPVVLVDDEDCWEGYSSDRIDALAVDLAQSEDLAVSA